MYLDLVEFLLFYDDFFDFFKLVFEKLLIKFYSLRKVRLEDLHAVSAITGIWMLMILSLTKD